MSPDPTLPDGPGRPLTGGVSSDIRLVETTDGPVVVKRALARLKVAAEWVSEPSRWETEVAAITAYGDLIGADHVPEVLWTRPEDHAFAMRLIEPRLRNWKQDLLAGRLDPATARQAGRLLGRVHARSAERADIRARFDDVAYFHQLRIDPFFLRVAAKHPDLSAAIEAAAGGLLDRRSALVHGDFSPKNMLVDGDDLVILDFETAHWGDPRFDAAFCSSHLMLKALRRGAPASDLVDLVRTTLAAYREDGPDVLDAAFVRVTGCLLLARLDGASPVDYRADLDEARVRGLATQMIERPTDGLGPWLADVAR